MASSPHRYRFPADHDSPWMTRHNLCRDILPTVYGKGSSSSTSVGDRGALIERFQHGFFFKHRSKQCEGQRFASFSSSARHMNISCVCSERIPADFARIRTPFSVTLQYCFLANETVFPFSQPALCSLGWFLISVTMRSPRDVQPSGQSTAGWYQPKQWVHVDRLSCAGRSSFRAATGAALVRPHGRLYQEDRRGGGDFIREAIELVVDLRLLLACAQRPERCGISSSSATCMPTWPVP